MKWLNLLLCIWFVGLPLLAAVVLVWIAIVGLVGLPLWVVVWLVLR